MVDDDGGGDNGDGDDNDGDGDHAGSTYVALATCQVLCEVGSTTMPLFQRSPGDFSDLSKITQ